jgi:Xaa-Pro dipeptidase
VSDAPGRFSAEEFSARLARLRSAMRARSLDAMILDDCEILAYFTGYETTLNLYRACIVPLEGRPFMVLRALDAEPFRNQSWFDDHLAFDDGCDPIETLAKALKARGFASTAIGFDPGSHALTVAGYEQLRRALPDARFVPMFRVPWELRLIKSSAEIARIRRAAQLLDQTLGEIIDVLVPGMTPRQVAAMAARRLTELGADPAHLGYIAAARGWNFLHARPEEKPLETGDVLHLELVSRYRGYEARLMRCVAIGPIDAERREAAERLVALQDAQLAAMKPGAAAREVDAILRNGVIAAGLRENYPNVTGYTLGYYSRVPIRSSDFTRCFMPSAEWELKAGMVFHMYTSAKGVSFSETVLVRDDGAERLTKIERRLFSKSGHGVRSVG